MADITMCIGMGCEKRNNCYRYTAISDSDWQSYSDFAEQCNKNDYEFFYEIPLSNDKKLNELKIKLCLPDTPEPEVVYEYFLMPNEREWLLKIKNKFLRKRL